MSEDPDYPHHYVMVRQDLTLAQQLVQAAHAAYEAGSKFGTPGRNGSMVMLVAPDERRLVDAANRMTVQGIPLLIWREADLNNEVTAWATAPLPQEQRTHFRRYRTWDGQS